MVISWLCKLVKSLKKESPGCKMCVCTCGWGGGGGGGEVATTTLWAN